ncbi:MAG: electron transfer flavoprotein subunit alpha/FixB family protein [Deltaproteobacteria bacterium]|nr:electron transfer flavoprotein subunit alpha/FixB family protein [Deltaproteobacteria bacterium]MBW2020738.1 electron transfer flavoprotein subunit alpha/FixB family protein [Deltaproteobacteria bacterium]MBW2073774.1 electron transfer flavoprotein subunit alpha/FixB family protein [Deltaproteobacteria bacterium]
MENSVWVYAENDGSTIADISLELLGKGKELADQLHSELVALIIGHGLSGSASELIAYGADKVYVAEHPQLKYYLTLPYTRIALELIEKYQPSILLVGATNTGRDLAPRIASHMRTGLTADCTDLQIGDYTFGKRTWKQILLQIRPAFGGNIIATIVTPEKRPQMATVREGVMKRPDPDYSRTGEIVQLKPKLTEEDVILKIVERVKAEKKVHLKSARIIVAGGMGVGSREHFEIIHELARTLGGEVGATRAAVDAGFIGREYQIGQTGVTVRPNLYIACGISGAIQHRAGMDQSQRIIAINTDPHAPIFSVAHYGIVGDLHEAIPKMIKAYKEKD